jgi:hypothetical protein
MGRDRSPRAGLSNLPAGVDNAQILLAGGFDGPADERLQRSLTALASLVERAPDDLSLVCVEDGVAEIKVPLPVLRRLRELLRNNDARLRMFRTEWIGLELGFGRREDWTLEEGRYRIRPPQPAPPRPPAPVPVRWAQPFLVAALVGCVAYAAAEFARVFWPQVSLAFLVIAPMVAAVEAGYSSQLMRHRRLFTDEVIKFRAIELLLLLILIKAGTLLGQSPAEILATLRAWPHNPGRILDVETVLGIVLGLIAWRTTTVVMNDLRRLGEPPEKSRYYVSPLDNLATRFFWGGGILLLLIGLSSIGRIAPAWTDRSSLWPLLARLRQSTLPDMVLILLAYHMLGLVMLGQIHLRLLRKGWAAQSLAVDETLGRRWLTASLALMGLALLVAFALPTGYTVGVLRILGLALAWVMRALAYLGSLLFFLFGLLLAPLLALLFGSGELLPPAQGVPQFQPPAPLPEAGGPPPEWLLAMRTVLFWGLALGVVIYVVSSYLRDHPELLAWIAGWRPLAWLRRLWAALRRLLGRWEVTVQRRLARLSPRRAPETSVPRRPFRFLRLSALSPREQILYYYWSVLKRAERWGVPRQPAQTPREYGEALESRLPEVEAEVDELTEAFVEARYSQHPVDSTNAQAVKGDWQKVKSSLRALKRSGPDPEVE